MSNMIRVLALFAASVVVAGCGSRVAQNPPETDPPNPSLPREQPAASQEGESKPEKPTTPNAPPAEVPKPANAVRNTRPAPRPKPDPGGVGTRFQIEREGWRRSELATSTLVARVDTAIAGMKGVGAETDLFVELPSGNGRNRDTLRIADKSRYAVPITIATDDMRRITLVSDGARKVEVANGQIGRPRPVQALLPRWLDEFPRYVFAPLTDGVNTWTQLSRELAQAGYDVRTERRDMPVRGQNRAFYRLLASKGETSIEIRIDGERMLPVTIRVVRGPDSRNKQLWTARYSFGHQFAATEFVPPSPVAAETGQGS